MTHTQQPKYGTRIHFKINSFSIVNYPFSIIYLHYRQIKINSNQNGYNYLEKIRLVINDDNKFIIIMLKNIQ